MVTKSRKAQQQEEFNAFILKRTEELQRENNFWETLRNIGFDIKYRSTSFNDWNNIVHMNFIVHKQLSDLRVGFQMNPNDMNIYWISFESWSWMQAKDPNNPLISCENFIKYLVIRVRAECQKILSQLDNRKI